MVTCTDVERLSGVLENWELDQMGERTAFINLHKLEVMARIYDWLAIGCEADYSTLFRRIHNIRHFLLEELVSTHGDLELGMLARQVARSTVTTRTLTRTRSTVGALKNFFS